MVLRICKMIATSGFWQCTKFVCGRSPSHALEELRALPQTLLLVQGALFVKEGRARGEREGKGREEGKEREWEGPPPPLQIPGFTPDNQESQNSKPISSAGIADMVYRYRFWCKMHPAMAPGIQPTASCSNREQNISISPSRSWKHQLSYN